MWRQHLLQLTTLIVVSLSGCYAGCNHGVASDGTCSGWAAASGSSRAYDNGAGVCTMGTYGSRCDTACPGNCLINDCEISGGACVGPSTTWDRINGASKAYGEWTGICKPGFYDARCDKSCPSNCLIEDCQVSGGACVGPNTTWNRINGASKAYGDNTGICKSGFYGERCDNSCPSNCLIKDCEVSGGACVGPNTTWDRINGASKAFGNKTGICKSGFYGEKCTEPCPSNCLINDCEVAGGACVGPSTTWDRIDGSAPAYGGGAGICQAGFYGQMCSKRCPAACPGDCQVSGGACLSQPTAQPRAEQPTMSPTLQTSGLSAKVQPSEAPPLGASLTWV